MSIDRRMVCAGMIAGAGCALVGACGGAAILVAKRRNNELLVPAKKLPAPGAEPILLRVANEEPSLSLTLLEDGSPLAMSIQCTHMGCAVALGGEGWACPCHGSQFDRQGEVLRGPAERRLERYPTRWLRDGAELAILVEEGRS